MFGRVKAERARQERLGYTAEHDQSKGLKHLIFWAVVYAWRRKYIKAGALGLAAWQLWRRGRNARRRN